MHEKGIFITFMAFLLTSTVLALTISINQAGIGQAQNIANEIAFKSVDNIFNNMTQQIMVVKEDYAGEAYSRFMPFEKFISDENWVEIEQRLPANEKFLEKTYDALSLFAIFAKEKSTEETDVNVHNVLQSSQWNPESEDYPKISYIILPQCLKISIGNGTVPGVPKFEGGSVAGGDQCNFNESSIESQEIEIHFDTANFQQLQCGGVFNTPLPCGENGDPGGDYYAEMFLVLDNCGDCPKDGFDAEGNKTVSGNLAETGDYINAVFSTGYFKLEFDNYKIKIIKDSSESELFSSRIVFKEPVEEIVLAPGSFGFSVKNPSFKICRATEEEGCN